MEAYVYLSIAPGSMAPVLTNLAAKHGVREAVAVVGEWDVLAHVDGPDLGTIASTVLAEIHSVAGVTRSVTAPVVPADRIGVGGLAAPQAPQVVRDACYVHIKAEGGAAAGLAERLSDLPDVSGVAVLGGDYDLIVCVAQPWEIACGVILEQIHTLPGILSTNTLVSIDYEEPEEDRDQFSTWI
jgi:DNA-binding Lrp family transcriptional regulator